MEAIHLVQWTWQRLIKVRCLGFLAADNTFNPNVLRQSYDGAAGDIKAFPAHPLTGRTCPERLVPDLSRARDAEVFLKDTLDLGLQACVTFGVIRKV